MSERLGWEVRVRWSKGSPFNRSGETPESTITDVTSIQYGEPGLGAPQRWTFIMAGKEVQVLPDWVESFTARECA